MHSEEDFLHGTLSGKLPIILEINEQGLINMFVDAFIQGKSIKTRSYVTLYQYDFSDPRMLFLRGRSTIIWLIFISLKPIRTYAKFSTTLGIIRTLINKIQLL